MALPNALAVTLTLAFAGSVTSVAPTPHGSGEGSDGSRVVELDPRDVVGEAKVSLREAIAHAIKACPGKAVEAELAGEIANGERSALYEIAVVTESVELFEVKVDPKSGEVVASTKEDDPETKSELRSFRAALRLTDLSLAQLVAKAEESVKGTAVKAVLEMDDGPKCEVVFVNLRYLIEADIEGRGGQLVDLGLESDEGEQADEEDEADEADEADEGNEADEAQEEEEEDDGKAAAASDEGREVVAGTLPRSGARPAPASVTPLQDGVAFSPVITHSYLPLSTVRYTEFESDSEKVIREVLDQTKKVGGVECLVLAEKEYDEGDLKEISYNYFAQDRQGNVYYFGEDVDDYEDGKVVGHGGVWLVGRNAKEPCLFMVGHPEVGLRYKSENSPPDAEEFDAIEALDGKLRVPAGNFEGVLIVAEGDQAEKWIERKYYARGVGLISENHELNLARVKKTDSKRKGAR